MIKINDKNLSNRNRNRSKVLKTEFNKIYVLHPKKLSDIKMSGYWWFPNIIRTTFIFSLIILHNEYMWMTCRSHMFIFFWCHENLSFESGMILSEHAFFNFSWFNHFWPKGWWAKSPKIFNAPVTPVWATTNEIKIIFGLCSSSYIQFIYSYTVCKLKVPFRTDKKYNLSVQNYYNDKMLLKPPVS